MEDIKEYWENMLDDGETLAHFLGLTKEEENGLKAMEMVGLFTAPDQDSPTGRITLLHILDYFQDIKKPTRNEIKRFIRDYSNMI